MVGLEPVDDGAQVWRAPPHDREERGVLGAVVGWTNRQ
jgi:hypothetical protein